MSGKEKNDKKKGKQEEEPLIELGEDSDMPLGEYMLHLYIQKTQGLRIDEPIDAIVKVEAFGKIKYTTVKDNVTPDLSTFWGQHIFVDKEFSTRNELENASFKISVFDHNLISRNSLIGETSMSCSLVHSAENHTLKNKWSVLTNSKKELCTSMGFLKFSVNFVQAGKARSNLEEEYDPKKNKDALMNLDLPPEILMKQRQIVIYLFKGADVVRMDSIGAGADPYVKVDFGGLKIKSDYKKNQLSPVFAQKLFIPTIYPTIIDKLVMNFKDYDAVGKNEYIGSNSFSLRDIENGVYNTPTWQYFYGAHEKADDDEMKEKMNRIPEIASRFKGSLLMAIELKNLEDVSFKTEPMIEDEFNIINEVLVNVEFCGSFFFEYIQNIKSKNKAHKIHLTWGGKEISSPEIKYNQGVLIIMKELIIRHTFEVPEHVYSSWQDNQTEENTKYLLSFLPDIILSIVCDDEHFSFYRFKPNQYPKNRTNEGLSEEVKLHADNAVSDLREDQAGILRCKVTCGDLNSFRQNGVPWNHPDHKPTSNFTPIYLICNLFQAKDLMSSDKDGYSDPLVQLYHFGSTSQSSVFPNTLNPIWNQRMVIKTFMVGDSIPSAIINVWDKDENWLGNREFEFLGYSLVNLSPKLITRDNFGDISHPQWYELCLGKNNPSGKIMIAFQIIPNDCRQAYDQFRMSQAKFWRIPVPKSRHHLKINILGLRDLESTGLFPVKTAAIKIATSSLRSVDSMTEGAAFTDLVAMPKSSGDNPSVGTVLTLSADIPSDIKIMPTISCAVQEVGFRLFGNDTVIGTFSISLGQFSLITKQNLVKKLKNLKSKYSDDTDIINDINRLIREIESSINIYDNSIKSEINFGNMQKFHRKQIETPLKRKPNQEMNLLSDMMAADNDDYNGKLVEIIGNEASRISSVNLRHENQKSDINKEFMSGIMNLRKKAKKDKSMKNLETKNNMNFQIFKKQGNNIFEKLGHLVAKDMLVVMEAEDPRVDSFDKSSFMSLGYATLQKNEKHYRKFISDELEDSTFMGEELFFTLNLVRGKKINLEKKNILSRVFGSKEEKQRVTGKFRGIIEVLEDSIIKKIQNLGIPPAILDEYQIPYGIDQFKHNKLDQEILKSVEIVIRVYVIDAIFVKSLDFNSENDTYMVVKLDKKKIKDKKTIMDRNNPKFYSYFEFEHVLPGASDVKVKFYDYDPIKSDEFIGETIIDIERRFFDARWRSFKDHPIETRQIYHPSSSMAVGSSRMFIEIYEKNQSLPPKRNIKPRPAQEVELRIVIWDIWDVSSQDFEDVSDLYVQVRLPSYDMSMKTDTHYRAQGGFGSFNWRIKFNVNIDEYFKSEMAEVELLIFDRDLLSANDYISSISVNVADLIESTLYGESRQRMVDKNEEGENSTKIVKTTILNQNAEESELVPKIRFSIDCLTKEDAKISPAGIGRGDPNQDPHLEAPKGRFQWTLNPLKLFEQLVGPQFRRKACLICCIVFCVLIMILIFPIFFSEIIASLFGKLFGL